MRVTDKRIFDLAARNSGLLRDRLQRAVDENSTGLRVKHPWDDPAVTGPIIGHRLAAHRQKGMVTVAERSNDELLAADNAMASLTDVLGRARELALQMSSDTYSTENRAMVAHEVRNLFSDAIGLLNTRVGNRFIFAGFQDDQPAFDATGAYQGDSGVRQVEAFPGVLQTVSIAGDVLARGTSGGPDIIATLTALDTALTTDNKAGIQGALESLDDGIEHLSLSRAQMGAASNSLYTAIETARGNVDKEKANISRLSEADIFESSTKLALAQRALEAALTASARSFDLTLLHKL